MVGRKGIGAAWATAVVAVVTVTAAAPPSRLAYARGEGATSCPDESEFRKAVAGRLGFDPFSPSARVSLTVELTKAESRETPGRLRGRVVLVDSAGVVRGKREMVAKPSECAELVTAMALAVSLALDALGPEAPANEEKDEGAPPAALADEAGTEESPSPPTPAASSPPPSESPGPPVPSPPETQYFGAVSGVVAAGSSPSVAVGAAATLGVARGPFLLGLEGRTDAPSSEGEAGGTRIRVHVQSVSLLPCARFARRKWLFLCGAASLSNLGAESDGASLSAHASAWFASFGARAGVILPVSTHLSAQVYGDVRVPIAGPTISLGSEQVWHVAPLDGAAGMGLIVHFP